MQSVSLFQPTHRFGTIVLTLTLSTALLYCNTGEAAGASTLILNDLLKRRNKMFFFAEWPNNTVYGFSVLNLQKIHHFLLVVWWNYQTSQDKHWIIDQAQTQPAELDRKVHSYPLSFNSMQYDLQELYREINHYLPHCKGRFWWVYATSLSPFTTCPLPRMILQIKIGIWLRGYSYTIAGESK